jgi:hypothetical protein
MVVIPIPACNSLDIAHDLHRGGGASVVRIVAIAELAIVIVACRVQSVPVGLENHGVIPLQAATEITEIRSIRCGNSDFLDACGLSYGPKISQEMINARTVP